jgi:hypothetical protein
VCLTSILKTARVLPPASNFLPSRAFEVSKLGLGLDQPKPSRNIQYLFDHPTPPNYLQHITGLYTHYTLERMDL